MTPRTLVRDLRAYIGQHVTVYGWVNTLRLQRKMQFVLVRDHTGMVQVAHKRLDGGSALEQLIEHEMPIESAIKVTGTVVDNAIVKLGGLEIIPESIEVTSRADSPLPINDQAGIDQRLDWRFLDLRVPSRRLIFEVQTTVEKALRDFAYAEGCIELPTPKLMGTASESGAEVFKVTYFDRIAYLAQSPQFYKQMAIASGIDKVFEIGPVFRAEPSFTSRHATEFTGIDVEIAWIDGVEDVMSFEERMLAHVLTTVRERHGGEIAEHWGTEIAVPQCSVPALPDGRGDPAPVGTGMEPRGRQSGSRPRRRARTVGAGAGTARAPVRVRHTFPGVGAPVLPPALRRGPRCDRKL